MGSPRGGEAATKKKGDVQISCACTLPPRSTFQYFHTPPSCTAGRAMAAGSSPSSCSAGSQLPVTCHNSWPKVQFTPGCPQSFTSLHSPAHRNNSSSCSCISLDWQPAFWPLLAPGHYLFPSSVPNTNSFSPAFCYPSSDSCSSHTALAWVWTSMPRALSRLGPVRRLILEVRNSDSVAQILVSNASLGSSR